MTIDTSPIEILINDDQDVYREGLVQIIRSQPDMRLVYITNPGDDLLTVVEARQPNVVITAVQTNDPQILEVISKIAGKYRDIGVIAVSMFKDEPNSITVIQAGARGCLLRHAPKAEVLKAIKMVYRLEQYYSQEIVSQLANLIATGEFVNYSISGIPQLTEKDKSFIKLLCQELPMAEIAKRLNVTVRTLEHRKTRLYSMLGKENVIGLMNFAIINGIYNPFEVRR